MLKLLLLLLCCLLFSGCTKQEEAVETTVEEAIITEVVSVSDITPLTYNLNVANGNTFVYDVLCETTILDESVIKLPDGFTADVYVATDMLEPDKYSVVLTGVQAEAGDYVIEIGDTHSFVLSVSANQLSKYITMSCATSATKITNGESVTITAKYLGIEDAKFMNYLLDNSYIELENCTGDISIESVSNGLVNCIIVANVTVIDADKPCGVIIKEGSATDVDGIMVNGCRVEFNVV